MPVRDSDGRIVAAFGADLTLEWLSKQVGELNLDSGNFGFLDESAMDYSLPDSYSFIIGRNGDYIVHPDSRRVLNDNFFLHGGEDKGDKYKKLGKDMLAGKSGTAFVEMDGIRSSVFYGPFSTGWSMGIVVPTRTIMAPGEVLGLTILIFIAIGLLVAFFLIHRTVRHTAGPLTHLVKSTEEVAKGNFNAPLPELYRYDEIRQLRDAFENMQHSLTSYISELTEATSRQASMDRELDIARDIQFSMLPASFPERKDVDIFASLTPAKAVGGDLYDFFIRDDKLFFCIGDVSGKGVPAAMVMTVTSALFRSLTRRDTQPASITRTLNNELCSHNDSLMFVTLFSGVLDLTTGKLLYCNAGHDAPILASTDGSVQYLQVDSNVAAGVMPDMEFKQQETVLQPGTTLFLYTDGLTEAENERHELFGMDRTLETAGMEGNVPPSMFIASVTTTVRSFVAGAVQSDDLTMLAIRYTGKSSH